MVEMYPIGKIYNIPDAASAGTAPFNSTTINSAPVNKKFQVMFNGVKYNMLLSDSNPVVAP
tara:strand:+ start:28 stop:210 length:183 start_codon:yes stop_codon:yes gene_type:complete